MDAATFFWMVAVVLVVSVAVGTFLFGLLIYLGRPGKKKELDGDRVALARQMSRYFLDGKPAEDSLLPDPISDGEWMVCLLARIPRNETHNASEMLRQIAVEAVLQGAYPSPLDPKEKCYEFGQPYHAYVSQMIGEVMKWVAQNGMPAVEKKLAEAAK